MLKTRRQRSFWARIKLSIILFQTPRRVPDFNNLESKSRFFYFRNVDLNREKEITALEWLFITLNTLLLSFFVLRLFSLPKIFALWLFFFPFPLISKTSLLAPPCFRAPQAKKNVSQNRLFCQVSFSFFQQNKLKNLKKNKNTSPDIQSLRCKHIMHNKHDKSLHRFEKTPYKLTVLLTHVIERIDKLKSFLFFTASNLLTNRSQAQRRL